MGLIGGFKKLFSSNNANVLQKRSYGSPHDAGRSDGVYSFWHPPYSRGDINITRDLIIKRARDSERNNPIAGALVDSWCNNVVGSKGYTVRSRVEIKSDNPRSSGKRDFKIADSIEDAFDKWSKNPLFCDLKGQLTFTELLRLCVRERFIAGEVFIRLIPSSIAIDSAGLMFEVISSRDLDLMVQKCGENHVVEGVELDCRTSRVVAYHFRPADKFGQSIRISAYEVIHYYKNNEPGQVRGVSPLWRVLEPLKTIDGYVDSVLIRAKTEADNVCIITTPGFDDFSISESSASSNTITSAPGTFHRLSPGENIHFPPANNPPAHMEEFIRIILRQIAAGVGISYETLSRDISQGSYSSTRLNALEDRKHYEVEQALLISKVCIPVYKEFVKALALAGKLGVTYHEYIENFDNLESCIWTPSGFPWFDPYKDVVANVQAIEAGLKTKTDVLAEQGKDFYYMVETLMNERIEEERMGLKQSTADKKSRFEFVADKDKEEG